MDLARSFGVVLHPTSLPGRWGIGTLGNEAGALLDWLGSAGARWWQVLPLGPTGYGDSPYQSFSAFAGNPYLLDPEEFLARGWLRDEPLPAASSDRVDFGWLYETRWPLLRRAYGGFVRCSSRAERRELARFRQAERDWLADYALFMALKGRFHGAPWPSWPRELAERAPRALSGARRALAEEVGFHAWTQWRFFAAWDRVRERARGHGIEIMGDMPIFVSHDSADVWAHRGLFHLDDHGNPTVVAGVPPDYFSATGQRWGNPLYRWDVLAADGFAWWTSRVRHALRTCDLVRLDHFRGLEAYWEIPAGEPTAIHGRWVKAPGEDLLRTIRRELGNVPIVAEDLGVITPEVDALRDQFELPGMRVLQFAFQGGAANPHLPDNYPDHGRILVYTGTHDNDTTLGWFRTASPAEQASARDCLRRHGIPADEEQEIPWGFVCLALASRAALAMIPLQDVLGADSSARMNTPGKLGGNWAWRCRSEDLSPERAARLRAAAARAGRVVPPPPVQ